MIKFSIIIPVYNGESFLENCISSIMQQTISKENFEILIIDDHSNDSSYELVQSYSHKYPKNIFYYQTEKNMGPGIARNIGIENAKGEWILFLDCDDTLTPNALQSLFEKVTTENLDILAFNWTYCKNSTIETLKNQGRNDSNSFLKNKDNFIKDYLALYMDGSVIYVLFKRKLIETFNIKFREGYHEDVDFLFQAYFNARFIKYLDLPIYIKNNRVGSIVNTISKKHIFGFFEAYKRIFLILEKSTTEFKDYETVFYKGIIGVTATRMRIIFQQKVITESKADLYLILYNSWKQFENNKLKSELTKLKTKYALYVKQLLKAFESNSNDLSECSKEINDYIFQNQDKSWSCYDLHYSLFLAPDEIRTCCKRYFLNEEIKGDVTLLETSTLPVNTQEILNKKQDIYLDINKDESESCKECPFLEFKQWSEMDSLNIQHLSIEDNSVCNMKCIYCSEKYYGGKTSNYNIQKLLDDFEENQCFQSCKSIVWGGGEPLLNKQFVEILNRLINQHENIKPRIISNSTIYSNELETLLAQNKITLTTSIDAGNLETFTKIRKSNQLNTILGNLQRYSKLGSKNITIKYIILEENKSIKEINNFVELMSKYQLLDCNFQISCNFKLEHIHDELIFSALVIYALLSQNCARYIFFDDLLYFRLGNMSEQLEVKLRTQLKQLNLDKYFADRNNFSEIIIWGAGEQSRKLITNSLFLKSVKVKFLVDDIKADTFFMGYPVYSPDTIAKSNLPVLISAVQNSPIIYEKFKKMGLNEKQLINGAII